MTETKRGRLKVSPESWHYRRYKNWKRRAHDTRKQIDLCHYVRVLLFWAPIRWFFQAGEFSKRNWISNGPIRPVTIVLLAAGIYGFVYLFQVAGDIMWEVVTWTAVSLAGLVAIGLLIWGIVAVIHARFKPVQTFFGSIARGSEWVYDGVTGFLVWIRDHLIYPPLGWFFEKKLFWIPGLRGWASPWMIAAAACYVALLYFFTVKTLVVTAVIVGGIAALIGVVALVYWTTQGVKKWSAARRLRRADRIVVVSEPAPEPGMSALDAAWQFLVAKKHRICPLIEETGGGVPTDVHAGTGQAS